MSHLALVTGGSAGIGRAICLALAAPERTVLVASRRLAACEAVAEQIRSVGGRAAALELDVTRADSIAAAAGRVAELEDIGGPLTELVNNAGAVDVHGAFEQPAGLAGDVWKRQFDVNFHGPRRLIEAFIGPMRSRGIGRIVNVASAAGLRAFPSIAAYVAAKHAMVGYTRAAAMELSGSGVTMAAVCPYYVDSPMIDRGAAELAADRGWSRERALAEFAGRNPGGRLLSMDEVAAAVVDLLKSGCNGRVLVLDGGPPREASEEPEP
ncbi:SDR family NAD(P)-dependent oxidoreductase [Engelhardtia mirabilis]|uniref:D-beta-hydroxybutyrate dehydrogenase n=1 Tax=Engelhardtia mirabilis TaxID=2528011 RepID=A0A518BHL9_9BACT|nr:D-beta-hydroxybutyrate dehydrogenase [Planctomycetes bacterium Pla133]QDV00803.1 D-beta-hydroxybutyrate dehydrogenase [Planctomycetes bacterium Pla86]